MAETRREAIRWDITRDGEYKEGPFDSHNQAFIRLMQLQPQSVHWARKYEGWNIVPHNSGRIPAEKETSVEIQATVKTVDQATDGYGETSRVIGVRVQAKYSLLVAGDEQAQRTLEFTLPLEYRRQVFPGDVITLDIGVG